MGEKELERETRAKALALVKRTTVVSNIRAIHAMALRVKTEPDLVPQFLVAITDLDSLWNQFRPRGRGGLKQFSYIERNDRL